MLFEDLSRACIWSSSEWAPIKLELMCVDVGWEASPVREPPEGGHKVVCAQVLRAQGEYEPRCKANEQTHICLCLG